LKDNLLILAMLMISITSFSLVNYSPIKPKIDQSGLNLSVFSTSFQGIGIELQYYNYKSHYMESSFLNRTIKLKTGESFFKAFVDLPIYNEKFGVGYEYMLEKNFFGVFSLNNFQRLESKSLSHNFYNITLGKFNIPSYSVGNIKFLKGNDLYLFEISSLLYRPFTLPFNLGYSNGFYVSLPLINFDNYYIDSMNVGFTLIEKNVYPQLSVSIPLNIFEQTLHIGSKFAFGKNVYYELYLFNENMSFPFLLLINNKGGALFIEL
jgi:hypothetical protein